ncbi:hypothetical protein BC826DRAFT_1005525 [Russula brevipes]|nr:hypothetical protein BC826DRAFT_1005525 [Russula brevipes]
MLKLFWLVSYSLRAWSEVLSLLQHMGPFLLFEGQISLVLQSVSSLRSYTSGLQILFDKMSSTCVLLYGHHAM